MLVEALHVSLLMHTIMSWYSMIAISWRYQAPPDRAHRTARPRPVRAKQVCDRFDLDRSGPEIRFLSGLCMTDRRTKIEFLWEFLES